MEDIDGGLHPAVDGQSLDEMRWETYMAYRKNEFSWITEPLMAETTSARSSQFLTMPTIAQHRGVIQCGACSSLSSLYGALHSNLFIALCSHENSSSPHHAILGNHIPVRNIDRTFQHGRVTLVLEAVVQRDVCPQTVPHTVSGWELWRYPCAQRVQATWDVGTTRWHAVVKCHLFWNLLYLGFYIAIYFLRSVQTPHI